MLNASTYTPQSLPAFLSQNQGKSVDPDLYGHTPILVTDDDTQIRRSLRTLLESWGCTIYEAADGREALEQIAAHKLKLVLSDVDMPMMDGFELLSKISADFPDTSVIMVSGMGHENIIDEAFARGAIGYIQKPYRLPELKSQVTYALRRIQLLQPAKTLLNQLHGEGAATRSSTAREFARLFVMTSDLHHVETGSHIRRIGKFSRLMAQLIGLPESIADDLGEAAVLHDIGKLAIPDAILKKPGPLTPEEFEVMKTHPVLGGQILSGANDPLLQLAHTVALYHHERWDGTGYPEKLRGADCPVTARIVGVVDVFDALTEKRVYKDAWPKGKIIEFFQDKRGSFFEEKLVDALLDNYDKFEEIRLLENKS